MPEQRDSKGVFHFPTPKSPMNKVRFNNRFSNMEFPDYEYYEYPKAIAIPIPDLSKEDVELPATLQRKVTEWQDAHGQLNSHVEPESHWKKRVAREWPNFYPIAEDEEHEVRLRKQYGLDKTQTKVKESA